MGDVAFLLLTPVVKRVPVFKTAHIIWAKFVGGDQFCHKTCNSRSIFSTQYLYFIWLAWLRLNKAFKITDKWNWLTVLHPSLGSSGRIPQLQRPSFILELKPTGTLATSKTKIEWRATTTTTSATQKYRPKHWNSTKTAHTLYAVRATIK